MTFTQNKLDKIFLPPSLDRAEPAPMLTPTLVIGLGGTGARVVGDLKQRLQARIDTVASTFFEFLVLDTQSCQEQEAPVPDLLSSSEYINLGNYDASSVLGGAQAAKWNWLPEKAKQERPGLVYHGTRQKRYLGRLSLFMNFAEFQATLATKLDNLKLLRNREQVEKAYGVPLPAFNPVRVYIVGSFGGGTGSGIFLDVAAWVNFKCQKPVFVSGIFTLPSVVERQVQKLEHQERLYANTYAALKELDCVMSSSTCLEVTYPGTATISVARPFNRLSLIEGLDQLDYAILEDQITYEMISQQIFIEVATPINHKFWQQAANISEERDPKTHRLMCYSSFVSTSIGFNKKLIEQYTAASLTYSVVAEHFRAVPNARLEPQLNELARQFVAETEQVFQSAGSNFQFDAANDELRPAQTWLENTRGRIARWLVEYGYGPAYQILQKINELSIQESNQLRGKINAQVTFNALDTRPSYVTRRWLWQRQNKLGPNTTLPNLTNPDLRQVKLMLRWWEQLASWLNRLSSDLKRFCLSFERQTQQSDHLNLLESRRLKEAVLTNERNPLNHELCSQAFLLNHVQKLKQTLQISPYQYFRQYNFPQSNALDPNANWQYKFMADLQLKTSKTAAGQTFIEGLTLPQPPTELELLEQIYGAMLNLARQSLSKIDILDLLFDEPGAKTDGLVNNAAEPGQASRLESRYAVARREFDQLLKRTNPYIRQSLESGSGDASLQAIHFLGVNNPQDRRLAGVLNLLLNGTSNALVNNSNPSLVEATLVQYGMMVNHFQVLGNYVSYYHKIDPQEILHTHKDWQAQPDLDQPLTEFDSKVQDALNTIESTPHNAI